jgi:hypothetical protein
MIGTGVGLMAADVVGDALILVTAGGFVYVAAVTILPDILNDTGNDSSASFEFRFAQILGFAIGIGFLYAVSLLEEIQGNSRHTHGHHEQGINDGNHDNAHHNHDLTDHHHNHFVEL